MRVSRCATLNFVVVCIRLPLLLTAEQQACPSGVQITTGGSLLQVSTNKSTLKVRAEEKAEGAAQVEGAEEEGDGAAQVEGQSSATLRELMGRASYARPSISNKLVVPLVQPAAPPDSLQWGRARTFLQAMHEVLQPKGVPVLLVYGSLLRWYRDGAVGRDHDLDFAIYAEDWINIPWLEIRARAASMAIEQNDPKGAKLFESLLGDHAGYQWQKVKSGGEKENSVQRVVVKIYIGQFNFDVWIMYRGMKSESDDTVVNYLCADSNSMSGQLTPTAQAEQIADFEIARADFMGVPVNVPVQIEDVLTGLYGDWKKPKTQFESDKAWAKSRQDGKSSCDTVFTTLVESPSKWVGELTSGKDYLLNFQTNEQSGATVDTADQAEKFDTVDTADTKASNGESSWQQGFLVVLSIGLGSLAYTLNARGSKERGNIANSMYMGVYMCFGMFEYLLAKWISHRHGGLPFPAVCGVLTIETLKLIMTLFLIGWSRSWHMFEDVCKRQALRLGVPAIMYLILNVFFYVVISSTTIAAYAITLEVQIVFVAIFWMILFGRQVSPMRILACVGVVAGFGVLHFDVWVRWAYGDVDRAVFLALAMTFWTASCTVTSEYVFKQDMNLNVNVQNTVMYGYGVVLGLGLMFAQVTVQGRDSVQLDGLFTPEVLVLLSVRAVHGLSVSRVLKFLDSVSKTIGSGLTGPLSIAFGPAFFPEPVTTATVLAASCTFVASFVYWTDLRLGVQTSNDANPKPNEAATQEGPKDKSQPTKQNELPNAATANENNKS
jgi:hypothetical protein